IDLDHLDEYLAFRYVTGENYLLKGVRQLRPGHCLRVNASGCTLRRYWELPDGAEKLALSDADALENIDHLLREAVRSQLMSDVPLGCQLSGGIDSSLVSVFARSHFDADMQTFSVVFDDPHYSEEHWISQAATKAKADSHRYLFTERFFFETL